MALNLSQETISAKTAEMKRMMETTNEGRNFKQQVDTLLNQADADKDGKTSVNEGSSLLLHQYTSIFQGNQELTAKAAAPAAKMQEVLAAYAGEDGVLSAEELGAACASDEMKAIEAEFTALKNQAASSSANTSGSGNTETNAGAKPKSESFLQKAGNAIAGFFKGIFNGIGSFFSAIGKVFSGEWAASDPQKDAQKKAEAEHKARYKEARSLVIKLEKDLRAEQDPNKKQALRAQLHQALENFKQITPPAKQS